jgi:hypothetical protein
MPSRGSGLPGGSSASFDGCRSRSVSSNGLSFGVPHLLLCRFAFLRSNHPLTACPRTLNSSGHPSSHFSTFQSKLLNQPYETGGNLVYGFYWSPQQFCRLSRRSLRATQVRPDLGVLVAELRPVWDSPIRKKFPFYCTFLHMRAFLPQSQRCSPRLCPLPTPPQDFSDIRYRDPSDSKWIDPAGPNSCDKLAGAQGPPRSIFRPDPDF